MPHALQIIADVELKSVSQMVVSLSLHNLFFIKGTAEKGPSIDTEPLTTRAVTPEDSQLPQPADYT